MLPYTMNGSLSPEEAAYLSEIFRIITKEIVTDDDKLNLAPGELGVSYTEGALYIRNPATGELFSPNSLSHIQTILSKFNPDTNELNANVVDGVKLYNDVLDVVESSISPTADTVISSMVSPSHMHTTLDYESYAALLYPEQKGILDIHKTDVSNVYATFYGTETGIVYRGSYYPADHQLKGWEIVDSNVLTGTLTASTDADVYDFTISPNRDIKWYNLIAIQCYNDTEINDIYYKTIRLPTGIPQLFWGSDLSNHDFHIDSSEAGGVGGTAVIRAGSISTFLIVINQNTAFHIGTQYAGETVGLLKYGSIADAKAHYMMSILGGM